MQTYLSIRPHLVPMNIVRMDELATAGIKDFSTDGVVRALSLFEPLFLPFFVVRREGELSWKDELDLAREYRDLASEAGCFVWRPGSTPQRVRTPQELILELRQTSGDVIVQRAVDVRATGTAELLPDGAFRVESREGLPGAGGRSDTLTVADGEIIGGEEDVISDDDLSMIRSAFSSLPDDLVVHWAIDGGLHAVWADVAERAEAEPEEEETEPEDEDGAPLPAPVPETAPGMRPEPSKVRFTAAEIYVEVEGDEFPHQADGVIVPASRLSSAPLSADATLLLRIERDEGTEEVFEGLKGADPLSFSGIILPPVCSAEELEYMVRLMEGHGIYRTRGFRILATVRYPCALLVADELLRVSEGLFVDTAALIDEMFGGESASSVVKGPSALALKRAVSILQEAADRADGEKTVIYSVPPGLESEMAALLVSGGARAVSTVPGRMESTVDAVAREEHRLLLREVGLRR